jgi:lipoprotein Spr
MNKQLVIFCIMLLSGTVFTANAALVGRKHELFKARLANGNTNIALVCADDLLTFAQTLIGTRYRSASSSPDHGFDCSGFVSYVFKSFNFDVPRSSGDFIRVGEKVDLEDAKPGDIILFTGTSTRSRRIGHVAIVMSNDNGEVKFIHSTSGKEHGVTITDMDKRYKHRFVQVIRLLAQNNGA